MEKDNEWMDRYHTEASKAKVETRKGVWSPELQERVSKQWNELIADVEVSLGEDPAGQRGQSLAARWNELLEEFTGRDQDIVESVGRMWADRKNWPAHIDQKAPVIKPETYDFIRKANIASGYSPSR